MFTIPPPPPRHVVSMVSKCPRPPIRIPVSVPPAPVPCDTHLPWPDHPPVFPALGRAVARPEQPTVFQETITIGFLPGDTRNVIDLSTPIPNNKRLLFRDVRLTSNLPAGQRLSIVFGSMLHFDATGTAPIDVYVDRKQALNVQVTRDSSTGPGRVTLVVEGSYVDLPPH